MEGAKKGAMRGIPVSIRGEPFGAMNRVSQSHDSIDGYNCRSWGLQHVTTPLCLVGNRDAIPVCMCFFQRVITSVLLVTGI